VHNTATQRQFSLYSPSSRPTSPLRIGHVEARGLAAKGWAWMDGDDIDDDDAILDFRVTPRSTADLSTPC